MGKVYGVLLKKRLNPPNNRPRRSLDENEAVVIAAKDTEVFLHLIHALNQLEYFLHAISFC